MFKFLKSSFEQILKYPTAIVGISIILLLVGISVYAMVSIPYERAIVLWRGDEINWRQNPKTAPPAWTNYFNELKKPESQRIFMGDENTTQVVKARDIGKNVILTYSFDFMADEFPQEMIVYFTADYEDKNPFISLLWRTPDGREIRIVDLGINAQETYRFSTDERLERRLGGVPSEIGLFADPNSPDPENPIPLKGTYQLVIDGLIFEDNSELIEAEFILHGTVHGLFGTDNIRRDIGVALLWGTPVALMFGLLASLGTGIITMIIAAVGVWFGGWVDELIQRLVEIQLVLPFLAILIMIGTFYNRSIWTMLGVTILLSIFGAGIKTYRAIFMQVKESPYIEAAQAYGASNGRIIMRYMIPRIIPLVIPNLVGSVPVFVFLEATLSVLGLGDPVLPTWGKVINDARTSAALFNGQYYWMLEPAVLLLITGLAFAMFGFALDRIFNPKLREV